MDFCEVPVIVAPVETCVVVVSPQDWVESGAEYPILGVHVTPEPGAPADIAPPIAEIATGVIQNPRSIVWLESAPS